MNHGLYHRFLGVALGSLIAESRVGENQAAIPPKSLSFSLWQQLAQESYGLLTSNAVLVEGIASLTGTELLRATMPLAVFFHDQPHRWVQLLDLTPRSQILLEAWGQIIAGILTDCWVCEGDRGITQLRSLLSSPALALLLPVLEPMESAIKTGLSARDFVAHINSDQTAHALAKAIALGLFSVWNISGNFRLAVLRSWHTTADCSLVSLTGALAGAGLGVRGIPWAWTMRPQSLSSQMLLIKTMESVWLHWLGCTPENRDFRRSDTVAIASAATLQPRPQLRLVSQNPIR